LNAQRYEKMARGVPEALKTDVLPSRAGQRNTGQIRDKRDKKIYFSVPGGRNICKELHYDIKDEGRAVLEQNAKKQPTRFRVPSRMESAKKGPVVV